MVVVEQVRLGAVGPRRTCGVGASHLDDPLVCRRDALPHSSSAKVTSCRPLAGLLRFVTKMSWLPVLQCGLVAADPVRRRATTLHPQRSKII
jgi:hypothetical protein